VTVNFFKASWISEADMVGEGWAESLMKRMRINKIIFFIINLLERNSVQRKYDIKRKDKLNQNNMAIKTIKSK
jgi:hypothetical protein